MDPLADRVELFARTPYAFEELIVSAIYADGGTRLVTSLNDLHTAMELNCTIKITSMEKFNNKIRMIGEHLRQVYDHEGPIAAYALIANESSPSQDWHADFLDGTWMKVIRGKLTVQYENGTGSYTEVPLGFDQNLYISAGTQFRTVNNEASILLVFELEKFMEDKAL